MQAVEAEGTVHEVGGAFARTTDPAEFDHILRDYIQFIHRGNDLVRDGVMAATLAKCGGVASVIVFSQTNKINIGWSASHGEC
jgi:hypothetical protein